MSVLVLTSVAHHSHPLRAPLGCHNTAHTTRGDSRPARRASPGAKAPPRPNTVATFCSGMIGTTWKWREPLAQIEADKWWSDGGEIRWRGERLLLLKQSLVAACFCFKWSLCMHKATLHLAPPPPHSGSSSSWNQTPQSDQRGSIP